MLRLETSVKISDTAKISEILKEKLPLFCIVRHDRIHHGLLEQNFLL